MKIAMVSLVDSKLEFFYLNYEKYSSEIKNIQACSKN